MPTAAKIGIYAVATIVWLIVATIVIRTNDGNTHRGTPMWVLLGFAMVWIAARGIIKQIERRRNRDPED